LFLSHLNRKKIKSSLKIKIVLLASFMGVQVYSYGQTKPLSDSLKTDTTVKQYDIGDLGRSIFSPGKPPKPTQNKSGLTPMPSIAYNPSIGAQIGLKAVVGKVLGNEPNTLMSVAASSASITTKGIIYFYLSHNVYTPGNRWNLQGSLVAAKTVTPDFGLGIGKVSTGTEEELILSNPERKGYAIHGEYYNFREKVYKQIMDRLFIGAGASFEIRRKLEDPNNPNGSTPYHIYNQIHGFDKDHYMANGFLLNLQYTTRDNQNRAYKGIYADVGIRANQSWIGSTKNAVQVTTDFRKYWSLSARNPEHVIAFWNWGSYLVSGTLPYLELPGTGKDANFRSGRGYTIGYFKGTQYCYSEIEYRFPITRNDFISGVTFFNIQTANDLSGTKLFQQWQPAGGAGLRVLFNKATRTNLCLDYAFGNFGAKGFFLGLNEVF
jgi:hypothetical protein